MDLSQEDIDKLLQDLLTSNQDEKPQDVSTLSESNGTSAVDSNNDPDFVDSMIDDILRKKVSKAQDNPSTNTCSSSEIRSQESDQSDQLVHPTNPGCYPQGVQSDERSNAVVSGSNFIIEGDNPISCIPTMTYTISGQNYVIPLVPVPSAGTIPVRVESSAIQNDVIPLVPGPSAGTIPVLVESSAIHNSEVPVAAVSAPTPGPSEGKKRKLYEQGEFSDPVMEKRRKNAINSKKHRDQKKEDFEELTENLRKAEEERNAYKLKYQSLKVHAEELVKKNDAIQQEIVALREENTRLKQQGASDAKQQEKLVAFDFCPQLPDLNGI